MLPALLVLSGCGGINSTQSVSPMSFFLPGLLKAKPVAPPASDPSVPVVNTDNNLVAQVR